MAGSGVIDVALRDAALAIRAELRERYPLSPASDFAQRKAVNNSRIQLAALLGTPRLYDVDRLDLKLSTTIDGALQDAVGDNCNGCATPTQRAPPGWSASGCSNAAIRRG